MLAAEYRALRPRSAFEEGSENDLVSRMHRDPEPLAALCISGGGIRCATFALGVLQGLAERGLLPRFDYLSTVSGGGYIGGWLTAWAHRAGGIEKVVPSLRRDAPPIPAGEPDPIQHLREYNSYMSPKGGALSTDVWTLVATVLRNILLNWMVLIPVLMFVLMVPRLYLAALAMPERLYGYVIYADAAKGPNWAAEELNAISASPLVARALPATSVLLLAVALFFTLRYLPGVGGRDHSRYDFSLKVLAPLVGAVLTFLTFDSLYYVGDTYVPESRPGPVVIWTLVPCAAAWLLVLLTRRGSVRERVGLLFGPLSLAIVSMAAGTGVAIWAVTNFMLWNPDPQVSSSWAEYVTVGPPSVLIGFALGTVLFVGLSSRFLKDEDREWMSRAVGTILLFAVVWAVVCAMVLLLPLWALEWRTWGHGALAAAGAASAWLSTLGGRSAAGARAPGRTGSSLPLSLAAKLAPAVFLALLAGALSVLTNIVLFGAHRLTGLQLAGAHGEPIAWTNHYAVLTRASPALLGLVALAFVGTSVLMARFVNINTFSLHGMYRDRLIRAYLGASNRERQASRFTGFAVNDDIPMRQLDPARRPFHVLNVALNLVAGSRLAWQQRKAASFTITAMHCGSREIGYRPSDRYAGGITLGTAVAISGAAASPNMGYHSSSIVGFIMTLFNARLGCWLGNPGPPGRRTWRHPGPLSAVRSMVKEALGQTSDQSEYVYLSDGGHFENLALYEMVRRRCKYIVLVDGACDRDFHYNDLGNALRKIRIDLRIPVDFEGDGPRPLGQQKNRYAMATIRYSAVDGPVADGRLVYVKPMLLGNEAPDVISYAAAHPDFPHQGTGDQWFDESQTESYRSLGLHTVDDMCFGWGGGSLPELFQYLETASLRASTPDVTAG